MPEKSFGYVPTPAIVAPIEFTLRLDRYTALGGFADRVVPVEDALKRTTYVNQPWREENPWPLKPEGE
jgi:hypothetical protein